MLAHEPQPPNPSDNQHGEEPKYTLTFSATERQVLQMALGELLQSVQREERLTPTIQALLERLRTSAPMP